MWQRPVYSSSGHRPFTHCAAVLLRKGQANEHSIEPHIYVFEDTAPPTGVYPAIILVQLLNDTAPLSGSLGEGRSTCSQHSRTGPPLHSRHSNRTPPRHHSHLYWLSPI